MVMIESGALSPDEARSFPQSNVILQALGVQDHVDAVISEIALEAGDVVLLCSDGLHGPVTDEKIGATMKATFDLEACARSLIQAALEAGAPDNVTVILARCDRTQ
jgi:serine/threonine protein phosphatase PrpC